MIFSSNSTFLSLISVLSFIFLNIANAKAQVPGSAVNIVVSENSEVRIQIKVGSPDEQWSFVNSYAGALGLGDRIKNFEALDSGSVIASRKIASGEFRSEGKATALRYTVQIPPGRPGDLAHISWLTSDSGVLMLADLLPESVLSEGTISVSLELPLGVAVESGFSRDAQNSFVVSQPDRAIFQVGKRFDVRTKDANGIGLKVVLADNWKFGSKDILRSAAKTIEVYHNLTTLQLAKPATILIGTLPLTDSDASWKAETRGSTVLLLLNPRAQVKNWIGQIGIILTHELFHLWVPNSLSLGGDYDWFFEGFTLYVALQTALKLKLINFREYQDTLARVYDSYLSYSDEQSLIEASERRWTTNVPVVYDKGMLVGFLLDLTMRSESGGATSLSEKYKVLFSRHAGDLADGNDVIIKVLATSPATERIASSYIRGRERIELEKLLPAFGFELDADGQKSRLSARKDLNDPQKRLLKSLGYSK